MGLVKRKVQVLKVSRIGCWGEIPNLVRARAGKRQAVSQSVVFGKRKPSSVMEAPAGGWWEKPVSEQETETHFVLRQGLRGRGLGRGFSVRELP